LVAFSVKRKKNLEGIVDLPNEDRLHSTFTDKLGIVYAVFST